MNRCQKCGAALDNSGKCLSEVCNPKPPVETPTPKEIEKAAANAGIPLSPGDAKELAAKIEALEKRTSLSAEDVRKIVAEELSKLKPATTSTPEPAKETKKRERTALGKREVE